MTLGEVGRHIDRDLSHINRPRVSGISLTAIFVVIPEDVARRLVPRTRLQRSVLGEIPKRRRAKVDLLASARHETKVAHICCEARSTSLPTIIAVRLATVGPEFGTLCVSGCAISTSSYGIPSVCAAHLAQDRVRPLPKLRRRD